MSTGFQGIKYDEISALIKSEVGSIASSLSGKRSGVQEFTSNGTFTVPSGVYVIRVTACAAGENGTSGGRGYNSGSPDYRYKAGPGGRGGKGGENAFLYPISVTPGQSISITVGTGNTVIGSYLTLLKGNGMPGGGGGIDFITQVISSERGENSAFHSGGEKGNDTDPSDRKYRYNCSLGGGGGGASILGAGGKGGSGGTYETVNNGEAGKGYGSGGGGGSGVGETISSAKAGSGGSGAPGKVIIEW